MAKKQVIQSTCDSCGKTENTEMDSKRADKGIRTEDFLLPEGWAHLRIDTNRTTIYQMDLCADCMKPVKETIGKYTK